MAVTPLRTAAPIADPLRMALREAIAAEEAARRAVTRQQEAIQRAELHLTKAQSDLEVATAAVAEAKALDAANVAAAIHTAAAVGAPTAARKARAAEQEAADAVDVAKAALARMQADLVGMEDVERRGRNEVAAAVNGVLQPAVEALLGQAQEYKSRLAVCLSTVSLILDDAMRRGSPLAGLRERHERVAALTATDVAGDALPAAIATWREALAALHKRFDVPLPLPPP